MKDIIPFTFTATALQYLSLDEPDPYGSYSVSVPVLDVPEGIAKSIPYAMSRALETSHGTIALRGNRKPVIFGIAPDSADLRRLRDFCALTGYSINRLLVGYPAEISGVLWHLEKKVQNQDTMRMAIDAIQINATQVKLPSWDDLVTRRVRT